MSELPDEVEICARPLGTWLCGQRIYRMGPDSLPYCHGCGARGPGVLYRKRVSSPPAFQDDRVHTYVTIPVTDVMWLRLKELAANDRENVAVTIDRLLIKVLSDGAGT